MNLPLQRLFPAWNIKERSSIYWCTDEDEFLMQSYANGMTVIEIATMLRRGRDVVQTRLAILTERLTTKLAGPDTYPDPHCVICGGRGCLHCI